MSAADVVFYQRFKVREVAMHLARSGLSPETIREAMLDLAKTEAEHAIAWAAEEDRRMAAVDREDFGDECDREERRGRETTRAEAGT